MQQAAVYARIQDHIMIENKAQCHQEGQHHHLDTLELLIVQQFRSSRAVCWVDSQTPPHERSRVRNDRLVDVAVNPQDRCRRGKTSRCSKVYLTNNTA
jgi:hypothetical protein